MSGHASLEEFSRDILRYQILESPMLDVVGIGCGSVIDCAIKFTIILCFFGRLILQREEARHSIQGSAGLENFVTAVAYHFCLSFPAAFPQPGNGNLAEP